MKYTEKLSDCLTRIGKGESRGKRVEEIPGLYVARCKQHYVFFLQENPVQIVAILHERMDCLKHVKSRLFG